MTQLSNAHLLNQFEIFYNGELFSSLLFQLFEVEKDDKIRLAFKTLCKEVWLNSKSNKQLAVINYINSLIDDYIE